MTASEVSTPEMGDFGLERVMRGRQRAVERAELDKKLRMVGTPQREKEEAEFMQMHDYAAPQPEANPIPNDNDDEECTTASLTDLISGMLSEVSDRVVENLMGEEETCIVCYEEARPSQMERTPCDHSFCKPCLQKIRETRPFCPLCRARIGEDPPPAYPVVEDTVLHLLVRLLSVSHSVGIHHHPFGRESRRVLLDIVLGMGEPRGTPLRLEDLDEELRRSEERAREEDNDAPAETGTSPSASHADVVVVTEEEEEEGAEETLGAMPFRTVFPRRLDPIGGMFRELSRMEEEDSQENRTSSRAAGGRGGVGGAEGPRFSGFPLGFAPPFTPSFGPSLNEELDEIFADAGVADAPIDPDSAFL